MAKMVQDDSIVILKSVRMQYPEGDVVFAEAHTQKNKTPRFVVTEITIEDEEALLNVALAYARSLGVNIGKALLEQCNILSRNAANSLATKGQASSVQKDKLNVIVKSYMEKYGLDEKKATDMACEALKIARVKRNGGSSNSGTFLTITVEDIKALFGKKE